MPYSATYRSTLHRDVSDALNIATDAPDEVKRWGIGVLAGGILPGQRLGAKAWQDADGTLNRLKEVYRTGSMEAMYTDSFRLSEQLYRERKWDELAALGEGGGSIWRKMDLSSERIASLLDGNDLEEFTRLQEMVDRETAWGNERASAAYTGAKFEKEKPVISPEERRRYDELVKEGAKRDRAMQYVERQRQENSFAMLAAITPDLTPEAMGVIERAVANDYRIADGDEAAFLSEEKGGLPRNQKDLVAAYLEYCKPTEGAGAWGQFVRRMGEQAWDVTKHTGQEISDLFNLAMHRSFRRGGYREVLEQRAYLQQINQKQFEDLGFWGNSFAEAGGIIGYWTPMLASLFLTKGVGSMASIEAAGTAGAVARGVGMAGRVAGPMLSHTMFVSDFRQQFLQRIALDGGDPTSLETQAAAWIGAVAADAVEHIAWGQMVGKTGMAEVQSQAYSKLVHSAAARFGKKVGVDFGKMGLGEAAVHVLAERGITTVFEAVEEALQQAIEEVVVDIGNGRTVRLGNLLEQSYGAFKATLGPMLLTAFNPFAIGGRARSAVTMHNLDGDAIDRMMSASERLKTLAAEGRLVREDEDMGVLGGLMQLTAQAATEEDAQRALLERGFSAWQANTMLRSFAAIRRAAIEHGQTDTLGPAMLQADEELARAGFSLSENPDGTTTATRIQTDEQGNKRRQTLKIAWGAFRELDMTSPAEVGSALDYIRQNASDNTKTMLLMLGLDIARPNAEIMADAAAMNTLGTYVAENELGDVANSLATGTTKSKEADGSEIDEDTYTITLTEKATRESIWHEVGHAAGYALRRMGLSEEEIDAIQNWRSGEDGKAPSEADMALPEHAGAGGTELYGEERVNYELAGEIARKNEPKTAFARGLEYVGDLVRNVLRIRKKAEEDGNAAAIMTELIWHGHLGKLGTLNDAQKRVLLEARRRRMATDAARETPPPEGPSSAAEGPSSEAEGTKPAKAIRPPDERTVANFCFNRPILRDDMARLAASGEVSEDDIYETGYRWSPFLRAWVVQPEMKGQKFTPNGRYMGLDGEWHGEEARAEVGGISTDLSGTLDETAWGDLSRGVAQIGNGKPVYQYVKGRKLKDEKPKLLAMAEADVRQQPNFTLDPEHGLPALRLGNSIFRITKSGLFHGADRRLPFNGNAIARVGSILNASVEIPNVPAPWHYRIASVNFGLGNVVLIASKEAGKAGVEDIESLQSINVKEAHAARVATPTNTDLFTPRTVNDLREAWQDVFLQGMQKHVEEKAGEARPQVAGLRGTYGWRQWDQADAERMEREGMGRLGIWRATGWWRGEDGGWRVEVPDIQMRKGWKERIERGVTPLIQLVDSETVQNYYLGSAYVWLEKGMSAAGTWDGRNIRLDADKKWTEKEIRSTLAHEIQHAIQDKEGFTSGTSWEDEIARRESPDDKQLAQSARERTKAATDEVCAAIADFIQNHAEDWLQRFYEATVDAKGRIKYPASMAKDDRPRINGRMIRSLGDIGKAVRKALDDRNEYDLLRLLEADTFRDVANSVGADEIGGILQADENGVYFYEGITDELVARLDAEFRESMAGPRQRLDTANREWSESSERLWRAHKEGMRAYYENGGEIEARMVQARLDLTDEQRKEIPPWVTEAVVRKEGGREMATYETQLATKHKMEEAGTLDNGRRYAVGSRLPSPEFAMDGTIVDALPAHLREDGRTIVRERGGTAAWMVEEDGTPTELNEREWLRREAERRHGEQRYQIAGGLGASHLGNRRLADAEAMERSRATREDIWRETGWWRGADGEWRMEIADLRAKKEGGEIHIEGEDAWCELGDMVEAPELFAAYPGIEETRIDLVDPGTLDGTSGYYSNGKITMAWDGIAWNGDGMTTVPNAQGVRVLTHEIQHMIQDDEEFARGTSVAAEMKRLQDEQNKAAIDARLDFEEKIIAEISDAMPGGDLEDDDLYERNADAATAAIEELKKAVQAKSKRSSASLVRQALKTAGLTDKAAREAAERLAPAFDDWRTAGEEKTDGVDIEDAKRAYYGNAGEVEARVAEARRNLDGYWKGIIPPWVTEQIVKRDNYLKRADTSFAAQYRMMQEMNAERGGRRHAVAPAGEQKQAGTAYPDAGGEIGDRRFAVGAKRRADYKALLEKKRPDLDAGKVLAELDKYDNPKKEKLALHWVIRGSVILPEDEYKVDDALSVAEKAKVDPFGYESPMALLEAHREFKPTAKPIDPDTVPELSDRREMGYGVVTYLVQDTREGQAAMRRIIDTHWGEDANPWCLLARQKEKDWREQGYDDELEGAWELWKRYGALPKRVAFKDGRLVAFMATDGGSQYQLLIDDFEYETGNWFSEHPERFHKWMERKGTVVSVPEEWWDRKDESHEGIPDTRKPTGEPLGRTQKGEIINGRFKPIAYERHGNTVDEAWDENGYTRKEKTASGYTNTEWHRNGEIRYNEFVYLEDNRGQEKQEKITSLYAINLSGGLFLYKQCRLKDLLEGNNDSGSVAKIIFTLKRGNIVFADGTLDSDKFRAEFVRKTGMWRIKHKKNVSDAEFRARFDAWREGVEKLVRRPEGTVGPEEVNSDGRRYMVSPTLASDIAEALEKDEAGHYTMKTRAVIRFAESIPVMDFLGVHMDGVFTTAATVRKMADRHMLTSEQIQMLVQANPVAVFLDTDGKGSHVILTDIMAAPSKDAAEKPVMILLRPVRRGTGGYIASAYSRTADKEISYVLWKNRLRFVDENRIAGLNLEDETLSQFKPQASGNAVLTSSDYSKWSTERSKALSVPDGKSEGGARPAVGGRIREFDREAGYSPRGQLAALATMYLIQGKEPDRGNLQQIKERLGEQGDLDAIIAEAKETHGRILADLKAKGRKATAGEIAREAARRAKAAHPEDLLEEAFNRGAAAGTWAQGARGAVLSALIEEGRSDSYHDFALEMGLDIAGIYHRFGLQQARKEEAAGHGRGTESEEEGADQALENAVGFAEGAQGPLDPNSEAGRALSELETRQQENIERAIREADMDWEERNRLREERRQRRLEREREAEAAGEGSGEGEGGGGEAVEDVPEGMDENDLAVDILERNRVDIRDPWKFALFLRKAIRNRILKANGLPVDFATLDEALAAEERLWQNPTNVAQFAKSMAAILRDMAGRLMDHEGDTYPAVLVKLEQLSRMQNVRAIEIQAAFEISTIARRSIRETTGKMVEQTRTRLQKSYIGKHRFGEHDELEEDLKRKITGHVRRMAIWYKRVLGLTEGGLEREREKLLDRLSERSRALDEAAAQGVAAAKDDDAVAAETLWKLKALDSYGGTRYLLPGEARERLMEMERWMATEGLKQAARIEEASRRYEKDRETIIKGCAVRDPATGEERTWEKDTWLDRIWRMTVNTIDQRFRMLFVRAAGKEGAAAQALRERDALLIHNGTTRYEREKQEMRRALRDTVREIVGPRGVRAWVKHLQEEIPEEHSRALSKQGYRHLTYGQVMHLYGYLRQTATYGDNIARHGRVGQRVYIERNVLTAEDIKILNGMMQIYAERRAALDEASRDITGFEMKSPDPWYMPVKIKTPTRSGLETVVSTVEAMPAVFSERRRHQLDVDEKADVMVMFNDRMEQSARVLGLGRTGLDIIHTWGSADVKDAMTKARGKLFTTALVNHLTDWMNGGRPRLHTSSGEEDKLLNSLRSTFTYTALGGNFLTSGKQTVSEPVFSLAREVGERSIFQDMRGFMSDKWKQAARELTESDPYKARYGDVGVMEETKEAVLGGDMTGRLEAFQRILMKPIEWGDKVPGLLVGVGGYMAARDRMVENGMEPEEAKRKASNLAMLEVERTQQSSRPENQPEYARRGSSSMRLLMMFASAPMLQAGWEVQRIVEYREKREAFGKDSKEARDAAIALRNAILINHVVMPLAFQVVSWGFQALLGRPPEKEDLPELIYSMVIGPFSRLLLLSGLAHAAWNAAMGRSTYGRWNTVPSALVNLEQDVIDAVRLPIDLATWNPEAAWKDIDRFLRRNIAIYRHGRTAWHNWAEAEAE